GLYSRFVKLGEVFDRHEHFAAYFKLIGNVLTDQSIGDFFNGEHVAGNVFAHSAIATSCSPNQGTVFVDKIDGKTINFYLGQPADVVASTDTQQASTDPAKPFLELADRKNIFQ